MQLIVLSENFSFPKTVGGSVVFIRMKKHLTSQRIAGQKWSTAILHDVY